ncbi:hypothetical protein MYCTH_2310977 [Thermothelomyces thermophilus ATCC 42464]|uniref:N-acetyltransferase domain-containing protein n=1 Tax=Thermothelomyces thermophilus (strain ATCC 42464 / BCRC 31852 / DSM 1799) TaxID=573729 RepID=G2QMD1_THET4|nr:uncharacterized protein MYCTH_2310977 [Thermothelomyces thermophilus ATCC 42464]AEO61111.1 hypothetical protein MYCTH_2310977 [Thermothelomyces thermophilus ATCC 42464]
MTSTITPASDPAPLGSAAEQTHEPALPEGYTLRPGYPPIQDYLRLRRAAGLTPKTAAQAAPIPRHSWYGCYITFRDPGKQQQQQQRPREQQQQETGEGGGGRRREEEDETVVAMGRIIGDGGWYFHIADMAVLPAHQRRGLGGAVLSHLLAHIKAHAPRGGGEGGREKQEEDRNGGDNGDNGDNGDGEETTGAGGGAYVTLFADAPGRRLYAKHGFVDAMPCGQMGMMMPMGWEERQ